MDVNIIEIETGEVIATYSINLRGLNYTPSDEEYFDLAWENAVDDGITPNDQRAKYSFSLSK